MAAVSGASASMRDEDEDLAADEVVEELEAEEKKLGIAQQIGDIIHLLRLPEAEVTASEKEEKRKELVAIIKDRGKCLMPQASAPPPLGSAFFASKRWRRYEFPGIVYMHPFVPST